MMTNWIGQAWEELGENYREMRRKFFQETVRRMTADDTDDDKIQPEGFDSYKFLSTEHPNKKYSC